MTLPSTSWWSTLMSKLMLCGLVAALTMMIMMHIDNSNGVVAHSYHSYYSDRGYWGHYGHGHHGHGHHGHHGHGYHGHGHGHHGYDDDDYYGSHRYHHNDGYPGEHEDEQDWHNGRGYHNAHHGDSSATDIERHKHAADVVSSTTNTVAKVPRAAQVQTSTGGSRQRRSVSMRRISYPPLLAPAVRTANAGVVTNGGGVKSTSTGSLDTGSTFNQSWVQTSDGLSVEYSRFKRTSCKIKKLLPEQTAAIESLVLSSTDRKPDENPIIICNEKRLQKLKDNVAVKTNKEWNADKVRAQCQYPNRWIEFEHCVLAQFTSEREFKRYQDTLKLAATVLENYGKFMASSTKRPSTSSSSASSSLSLSG